VPFDTVVLFRAFVATFSGAAAPESALPAAVAGAAAAADISSSSSQTSQNSANRNYQLKKNTIKNKKRTTKTQSP